MTHLWVRAEQRPNEERVGLTPEGAKALLGAGIKVTVEESSVRAIPLQGYIDAGCDIAAENAWPDAPKDAIIFGLKELPEDGTPLPHRHIMFGHAFKGQHSGKALLERFKAGGGTLYDLEYLVDDTGRRVAAFGYWAGYAGAAVTLKTWAAQQRGEICGPVGVYSGKDALLAELGAELDALATARPSAMVIGALGRVGTGAADLCEAMGVTVTKWDMAETASGGPFPQILAHGLFFNCIFARPGTPVFVPREALEQDRQLTAIGDVACDPDSDYNPVPVYTEATTWEAPALRVAETPVLDVMAIDNLPSMLPIESSQDYAAQLLSSLLTLTDLHTGVWGRAETTFKDHLPG
ncbi:saccharopine dehydrogenase [Phaeobacter gallaeciensis]|uniref:Saccharopine dehydrogenase [NAD(+), L-lysine-forming] n=1 Tax=Phaeobacter gallaeciensis TaxID=60890 RepID=A0AAD0EEJ1_9RHOB|nr:saccharopine dehydrogenase [Phaeobacter gallaeciensis]AHD11049.1 saccharopine dehydrogenase (NAD+, L-lysine-forming) [Phaeobacter gallaeciensis DSM 26640]ATE94312.1 putative saccharopine dehydrogenase (NAD+, L-lysine-forming) [Phaeobacter gallaeciensis]ATE98585.1 putative saccharopine dehydrogenase (NAD+, L-lysine-forming) [Phaeobacter gallaeciensis]ATF02976.1 putative saccharopine dehydrogenase (NAD+, L-lysine-forming) [Phaeobacter gallaeciensis]ATF07356.1 putative saccharopine dehydrogena